MKKMIYLDDNNNNIEKKKEIEKKKINDKLRKQNMHDSYDADLARFYKKDRREPTKYKKPKYKNKDFE